MCVSERSVFVLAVGLLMWGALAGCNPDPRSDDNGGEQPDTATDGGITDIAPDDTSPIDAVDGTDDTTSDDGGDQSDGTAVDGDGGPIDTSPDITCSGDLTACGSQCVDLDTANDNCGQCGRSCGQIGTCNAGSCNCPKYHRYCSGSCVPVNLDPDNCGSCGNECTGTQVCSGGQCQADCPTGLTACTDQNVCADLDTSNDNCGTCGNTCPSGESCVSGTCQQALGSPTIPGSNKCAGGGPPINVGIGGTTDTCTGDVAEDTFRWGLCTCDSVTLMNNSIFDAYDSTAGPYVPYGAGGSVGTNGSFTVGRNTVITGSLWSTGSGGIDIDKTEVYEQVRGGADFTGATGSIVEGDGYIEGNVNAGTGGVTFEQNLYVNSGSMVDQQIANNTNVVRQTVSVPDPCGLCDPQNQLPIGQIVSNHSSATNNDNDLINLSPSVLSDPGQEVRLDLPCGEYYLDEVISSSRVTIVAHGRTALYIDGDVEVPQDSIIKPTPSSELDVFVAGDMTVQGGVNLGSAAYPASTRVYVGGPNGFQLMNDANIGANIYAIPGGFTAMNNPEIYGSVYASDFTTMNNAEIHYDRESLDSGESCPDPTDPGGDVGPDADAGTPSDGGTIDDGGTTDDGGVTSDGGTTSDTSADTGGGGGTCSDQGQTCSSDADCCSPLVCNSSTGTCEASSCTYLYDPCSSNSECCSGNCVATQDGMVCLST